MEKKELLSTAEVAQILGISRQAVFKKIKSGEIKAERAGRSFVVRRDDILEIAGRILGEEKKRAIEKSVGKTLTDYGEAIRRLGQE
ncbi:MAG TPA: helix-turn-helix domain-containing protein [Candidatus Paceibacterota bacterium]|jgi:excisionase family DNA binding protein|nr:helix-turn-helix domain-containing protein [Candidatus Paceibacterota bacterium]